MVNSSSRLWRRRFRPRRPRRSASSTERMVEPKPVEASVSRERDGGERRAGPVGRRAQRVRQSIRFFCRLDGRGRFVRRLGGRKRPDGLSRTRWLRGGCARLRPSGQHSGLCCDHPAVLARRGQPRRLTPTDPRQACCRVRRAGEDRRPLGRRRLKTGTLGFDPQSDDGSAETGTEDQSGSGPSNLSGRLQFRRVRLRALRRRRLRALASGIRSRSKFKRLRGAGSRRRRRRFVTGRSSDGLSPIDTAPNAPPGSIFRRSQPWQTPARRHPRRRRR